MLPVQPSSARDQRALGKLPVHHALQQALLPCEVKRCRAWRMCYRVWRVCRCESRHPREMQLDLYDWQGLISVSTWSRTPPIRRTRAQDRLVRFWCRPRRRPRARPRPRQRKQIRPQGSTGCAVPLRANLDRPLAPRGSHGRSPAACSEPIACSTDIDAL